METPLVSSDGFPRSDINLVEIRTVRVKIIKLKNDLRAVLEELSNRMTQQFQSQLETPPSSAMASLQVSLPVSFAIVSEVVTDGPAHRSVSFHIYGSHHNANNRHRVSRYRIESSNLEI